MSYNEDDEFLDDSDYNDAYFVCTICGALDGHFADCPYADVAEEGE